MTYEYERFASLKQARERCKELERQHKGQFFGIYKGHRHYVVQIATLFEPGQGLELDEIHIWDENSDD